MKTRLLAVLVVAVLVAGNGALGAPGYMQLAAPARQLGAGDDFPGMWEYVYDVIGDSTPYIVDCGLYGFDASLIVNQWTYTYDGVTGTLVQNWDWNAAHGGGGGAVGSQSFDGTTWTPVASAWGIDNPWHAPDEYVKGANSMAVPGWYRPGVISGQSLMYTAKFAAGNRLTGMTKTFRIVHPNAPGTINWWVESAYGPEEDGNGTITGPSDPPPPPPGDADGDMDVDDIDIDMMGDHIRTGTPPSGANYDLTGFDEFGNPDPEGGYPDGVVDLLDLDYLIRVLVETTVGTGTEYGDFNLDGLVDTTDLTRLATNFGPGTMWTEGNANRNFDLLIDTTDLTILGTFFGFDASVDAIPEPMTLGLLALGASGVLARRSRAR